MAKALTRFDTKAEPLDDAQVKRMAAVCHGEPEAQAAVEPHVNGTKIVEVPYCSSLPDVTWGMHLDAELTPAQGNVLRRVAEQLDRKQARLANGSRVTADRPTTAVKFLLELLAE